MEKLRILTIFVLLLSMGALAGALNQKVTVNVIPAIIQVYSPTDNQTYQYNNIVINLTILGENNLSRLKIFEGRNPLETCIGDSCRNFISEEFFSNGEHTINIRVEFKNGDVAEKKIKFNVDSIAKVYINKNQVLKEATAQDIANYLFNNNFSINYKKGIVTDDSCSIRAETGKLYLNEVYFNNNTKLNFYSSAKLENGQGEITSQKGRKYVSYKFKVSKVLENSNNSLVLIITDKRTKKNSTLEFNKLTNKIIINGVDKIEDLKISFVSGCQNELKNYYLLGDSPTSKKTIEQVRALLNENPILIKNHESLKKLYHDFWFVEVLFGI